jgi:hypothetical protein
MTRRTQGEEPTEGEEATEGEEPTEAAKPQLDPDRMSVADQLRVQETQAARDAADARGDEQAVRDLDEQLRNLLTDPA